jgi:mono/diheme cytochrome c family protein
MRRLQTLLCGAILAVFAAAPALANPVPADDMSIANGYEIYDLHCASCHGTRRLASDDQWYEPDPDQVEIDYEALIDQAQAAREAEEKRRFANIAARDGSGRWAEIPDPGNKANDADVRAQIMEELVAEIDREYGLDQEVEELDPFSTDYDLGEELGFDDYGTVEALPGAPDLSDPESFIHGIGEQALFTNIALGIGDGSLMPGYRLRLGSDEAVWDVVNYIQSLWAQQYRGQ